MFIHIEFKYLKLYSFFFFFVGWCESFFFCFVRLCDLVENAATTGVLLSGHTDAVKCQNRISDMNL